MRADNSAQLAVSARQCHELTRSKSIRALRELDATAIPVAFESVARHAGVSRSWLYTQPDIRVEIDRLRSLAHPTRRASLPTNQRGSDASLARRLEIVLARNRELTTDNQRLRRQLAHALGQLRVPGATITEGRSRDTIQ